MRIAGYIEHPELKITIFQMDNRFTVKFEDSRAEQAFKFRTGPGLQHVQDLRRLIDPTFIDEVSRQMQQLHRLQAEALARHAPPETEDEFEDIL